MEHLSLQVVSDGPDSEEEILKSGFVRMIFSAEKSVWIQTPYLIPDDSMINALLVAVRSGVDVRIMIPCMPDHPLFTARHNITQITYTNAALKFIFMIVGLFMQKQW